MPTYRQRHIDRHSQTLRLVHFDKVSPTFSLFLKNVFGQLLPSPGLGHGLCFFPCVTRAVTLTFFSKWCWAAPADTRAGDVDIDKVGSPNFYVCCLYLCGQVRLRKGFWFFFFGKNLPLLASILPVFPPLIIRVVNSIFVSAAYTFAAAYVSDKVHQRKMRGKKDTCMHACTYMHACMYMHTYIHIYMHTYIHTYMHTCVHTHIHTYTHTHIRTNTSTHTYIQACIQTCIQSFFLFSQMLFNPITSSPFFFFWHHLFFFGKWCQKKCPPRFFSMCVCMYICIYTYIYIWVYTYIHAYIHIFIHVYLHTPPISKLLFNPITSNWIHLALVHFDTYIHTYIHVFISVCTHSPSFEVAF
jgi:hypothetical protein